MQLSLKTLLDSEQSSDWGNQIQECIGFYNDMFFFKFL